jgi:hypothetical protein
LGRRRARRCVGMQGRPWRVARIPPQRLSGRATSRYVDRGMMRNHFKVPGKTIQSVVAVVLAVVETVTDRISRGGPCFWSSWVCRSCAPGAPANSAAQTAQMRPSSRQRLQRRIGQFSFSKCTDSQCRQYIHFRSHTLSPLRPSLFTMGSNEARLSSAIVSPELAACAVAGSHPARIA